MLVLTCDEDVLVYSAWEDSSVWSVALTSFVGCERTKEDKIEWHGSFKE